jgi:hypothetical protein
MIIYISQNKLFELLQSEKFVVGNSLFAKAIQLIENLSKAPGKFVLLYCTVRVLFVNTYLELAKRD